MTTAVLLALVATVFACVVAIAGVHALASGRARSQDLVDRLDAYPAGGDPAAGGVGGRARRFTTIDRRLRRTRLGRSVHLRLSATGLDVTAGEFSVYVAVVAVGLWLLAASTLAPFFGPIAALVTIYSALIFLNWQRQKRIEAFINQLPDVARLLANATAAGLALRTSLAMAADELEAPAGEELSRVADQLALGRSVDDALDELATRLLPRTGRPRHHAGPLQQGGRHGGLLLRNLTKTLEDRKETRREIRTMLSEVNATAFTVPLLGLGSLLLINSSNDGALARVTDSGMGRALILISLALYGIGFFVIRRLGRIEV